MYIAIWLAGVYFSGGYDKPVRWFKIWRGLLFSTIVIAAVYGMLAESYRFSRGMFIMGGAWAIFSMTSLRFLLNLIKNKSIKIESESIKKIIIVGESEESQRVLSLLTQAGSRFDYIGWVSSENVNRQENNCLGTIDTLDDIVNIYDIDEIIFCSKHISAQRIINWMTKVGPQIDYKILPEGSLSIIGSNSKNTAGDLYAIDINLNISTSESKRNKRLVDLVVAVKALILLPVLIFVVRDPLKLISNCIRVLLGLKTWVGYTAIDNDPNVRLPKIKQGVLTPVDGLRTDHVDNNTLRRLNLLYAKGYSAYDDLEIILKGVRELGR